MCTDIKLSSKLYRKIIKKEKNITFTDMVNEEKADAGKIYVVDDRNVGGRNIGNINV